MFANTRAYVAIVAAVALAYFEIRAGIYAYANAGHQTFAIAIACLAVVGFAFIDLVLRPRKGTAGVVVRRYLSFWALVPFLCALGASAWMHVQQWQDGMDDIGVVADDLKRALCPTTCDWNKLSGDDVERAVDAMIKLRFPGDDAKSDEAHQFDEIARVVGTDLVRAKGNRDLVVSNAQVDTLPGFLLAFSVQALFVLWIPLLLAMKIHKAYRELGRRARETSESDRKGFTGSVNERDKRILGEGHAFFVPRFCFGALLVLGTNYVLAPYGLKASYIMSLVDEHALPGHASQTLWSTSFSAAPVIVVGFVGFLIYALITATQRFIQDDLDDQALLSLLVRGLVVILLSFALSSSPIDGTISRLFVFVAGVFPVRALEALSKRANVAIDPEFETETTKSFEGVPSLDPTKVFALRSAGIQSSYDLAAIPIEDIAARVRIDPRLLGRAVDRAILIEAVGLELAKKLEPFAITSATELVNLSREGTGLPDPVAKAFGDTDTSVKRLAERLADDERVKTVAAWLGESRGKVGS
ncbi:MAG: hypothetical protein JWO36_3361 [Myxococcales bacterium]|nr:hypothetical protein [Myxococcales bacterium]